jgi:ribonuclease P protein component
MLSSENRLKKKKDIERVFKKGKTFKDDFFVLRTVENNSNNCRFAFIVPKKVSNKASDRNKIKRRAREIIKNEIKKKSSLTDNVIIALPRINKENFESIKKSLEKLFKKIN